jgi:hypothetical protein
VPAQAGRNTSLADGDAATISADDRREISRRDVREAARMHQKPPQASDIIR